MKGVEQYGRLFFFVKSNSRRKKKHLVDLEQFEKWPCVCNCEAWKYNVTRPVCRHVVKCIKHIIQPIPLKRAERTAVKDAVVWGLQMGIHPIEAIGQCLENLHGRIRIDLIESKPAEDGKKTYTLDRSKNYVKPVSVN